MNRKERLYAVIGGAVGAVLALTVCSFFPPGAQSQSNTFGEITCTRLKVVNANGVEVVSINGDDKGGTIYITEDTKSATVEEMFDMSKVVIGCGAGAAKIEIWGGVSPMIGLGIDKNGGTVNIYPRDFDNGGRIRMLINEYGGRVNVTGMKTDYAEHRRSASLAINEHGGYAVVFGRGNDEIRAAMGVNEYGNGAVSTWDKNGYRLSDR
ncbi:MAG: hypothetical protein OXN17_03815 [Candidatus Poribacteria bacterium]|nr:hypothetical protein [Candidatus Poribacteria bacterium]MDE0505903.1 hypothetical protein [Candidatus Poribacteria bacterium]